MGPENKNYVAPVQQELSETSPDALAQFNALTSTEAIAAEKQRLYGQVQPFLDDEGVWDNEKMDNYDMFLARKGMEVEEAGDVDELAKIRTVRKELDAIKPNYYRYRDLNYDKPIYGIAMGDPRGQSILEAGEAKPRESDKQLFVPMEDARFQRRLDNDSPKVFMQDIATQQPGVTSIAVNRLVGVAASFTSWTSGYAGDSTKREEGTQNYTKGADLIQNYATRPTDIPPLDEVTALITTDGAVYYLATGGAHRAAAAIMKGQERLQVNTVVLRKIDMASADIEGYRP